MVYGMRQESDERIEDKDAEALVEEDKRQCIMSL
jgi:hypothetical protein